VTTRENCPYFPAQTKLIHHSFADPAAVERDEETSLQAFRKVRDGIHRFLLEFISKY
jgi:arsenate reductase